MINLLDPKTKKANEELKNNEIRLDSPIPDFIPYACHYNKDTILTKNGELLQTIEIKGFSNQKSTGESINIRDQIRQTILKTIKSSELALYFHTIRHAINLDDNPKFPSYFAKKMHDSWVRENNWTKKHVNSLYITIVKKGIDLNFASFLKKPFISLITKHHNECLVQAHKELASVTSNILNELKSFQPVKLGMKKDNTQGYYSTLVKFFSKIIHINASNFPITLESLSQSLAINKVAFGFNALEIKKANRKFFATIFSIKENNEINTVSLGKFLQMPQQMIITQVINFINPKKGHKEAEHQSYILDVSKDSKFKDKSGINELETINIDTPNAFCSTQTTVMVIAEDLDRLKQESLQTYQTLGQLGLPSVKEDLNLEHCFWSQLPGNFTYIARKSISLTKRAGNFAVLNNLPFGELKSKWGSATTLFETTLKTPYFFNFHNKDNGHTILIGDDEAEKSITMNFLLSEASKFNTKFIYLDSSKRSKLYMNALGVEYKVFNFDKNLNQLKMNPLLLEDNESNRSFLIYWFIFLLNKYTDTSITKKYLPVISKAIEVLFTLPTEKRKLSNVAEFFNDKTTANINKEIIAKLDQWGGEGNLAHIFDNDSDYLIEKKEQNISIDISSIYDTSMGFNLPVLSYILHFFKEYFTGDTPSILCVSDASRVFNSIYFELNLEYILDDFTRHNSIMLMHASFCSEKVNWSEKVAKVCYNKIKTQIFMADSVPSYNNIVKLFNLDQQEQMYLQTLTAGSKQFLLRHNLIAVILTLDLSRCDKELAILSGDPKYTEDIDALIKQYGDDPNTWLPKLYET